MRIFTVSMVAFLAAMILPSGIALGEIETYSSESTFLAAVDDELKESFEDETATNSTSTDPIVLDDFSLSTDGTMGVYDVSAASTHATDGSQHVYWSAFSDDEITNAEWNRLQDIWDPRRTEAGARACYGWSPGEWLKVLEQERRLMEEEKRGPRRRG